MACKSKSKTCYNYNAYFRFNSNNFDDDLVIDNKSQYFTLLNFEGLNGVEKVFIDNVPALIDGITNENVQALPRYLTFKIIVKSNYDRRRLNSFFQIGSTGKLYVAWNGTEQEIKYQVYDGTTIKQNTICDDYNVNLVLRCNYPFWQDMKSFSINSKSISSQNGVLKLFNNGDVAVGFYAKLMPTVSVINPKITLNNDKTIKILTTLKKGDVLEISTVENDLFVLINGVNKINYTDITISEFFKIPKGASTITISSDNNITTTPTLLSLGVAYE